MEMSDLIFLPFDFLYAVVMLVFTLGFSTITGVFMYGIVLIVKWQYDRLNRASDEALRVIEEKKQSKL